jgi:diacylglycerol kinase family enzyme
MKRIVECKREIKPIILERDLAGGRSHSLQIVCREAHHTHTHLDTLVAEAVSRAPAGGDGLIARLVVVIVGRAVRVAVVRLVSVGECDRDGV